MKSQLVVVDSFISKSTLQIINATLDSTTPHKLEHGASDDNIVFTTERFNHITNMVHKLPSHFISESICPHAFGILNPFVALISKEIERSFNCYVHPEQGYMITTFVEGESLDPHFDSNTDEYTILKTPNGNPKRDISSVLYLNDNYAGGELEFLNLGIKIKPRAGMLVLFPGSETYMHHVSILQSGRRYVIPQFWAVM